MKQFSYRVKIYKIKDLLLKNFVVFYLKMFKTCISLKKNFGNYVRFKTLRLTLVIKNNFLLTLLKMIVK